MAFKLTVEDFQDGANIPVRFTCDGDNAPPALTWVDEPSGTMSFVLIVDDPDAPVGIWNHWLVWDIPAHVHALAGNKRHASVGTSGTNDFGRIGYGGPCPPKGGGSHRYFFRLFALRTHTLGLSEGAKRSVLDSALKEHVIAETSYMGRYERR
jgi:Raf kinase inhibitor-like YbhB/YbcL family protein